MKTLLLAVALTFAASLGYCDGAVWKSSFTATADTTQSLCGINNNRKGRFHGVCLQDTPGTGTLTMYDSQGVASNPFTVIRATSTTKGCHYYDVQTSSGLTYTTSGALISVTFLYECY